MDNQASNKDVLIVLKIWLDLGSVSKIHLSGWFPDSWSYEDLHTFSLREASLFFTLRDWLWNPWEEILHKQRSLTMNLGETKLIPVQNNF